MRRQYPPDAYCDADLTFNKFAWHWPFRLERDGGITVTTFRDPISRMVSQFHFGPYMTPHGFSPGAVGNPSIQSKGDFRTSVKQNADPLLYYTSFDMFKGCQTKMLNGHACASPMNVTRAMIDEAKRRIEEELVFFWLTEEWQASMELFYKIMGGAPQRCSHQHVRGSSVSKPTIHEEEERLVALGFWDPDEEIHWHATKLFRQRCKDNNVAFEGAEPLYFRRAHLGIQVEGVVT
eukprot:CAMPEP_0198424500 /NCGR_PEP_ID=MMETSP1452-20131203/3912_1 /TAXON_ID=1181717 /ORGANISM="Synchroma pusillum, Strain CCMP3072" /LENGTH=234 /DNA_ID=CAMNT_0044144843 /DNA_START=45 /DNA_END=749 /DNA_ORIENTATION=-